MNDTERLLALLGGADESVHGSGTQTAPGAGATIATTAALPAGDYDVEVIIGMTGTAETLTRNADLTVVGVVKYANMLTVPGNVVRRFRKVTIPTGGGAIAVKATAAATGGAIYTASIHATRTG